MIAKRVPRRRDGKSSFGSLVKYLQDDQGKLERVGDVSVTNCGSEDPQWAVREIEAVQDLNRRAKSDKTYHLVFSFREGEDISPEVLKEIEGELCKGLGYADHQRISVVHRDTDNLHVHVAINKIHPQTHNMIEPYYDHKRLGELCSRIELTYGLERDNHAPSKSAASSKADDLAAKSELETLAGWIRSEALEGISKVGSWQELHGHLAEHGLQIRKKGAGLVFETEDGISVRASSVDRACSLKTLEGRLGSYEESAQRASSIAKKTYRPRPRRSSVDSSHLYARYQKERDAVTTGKRKGLGQLKSEKDRALQAVLEAGKKKRAATKLLKGLGAGAISRRLLYAQIASSQRDDLKKVHEEFARRRKELHEKKPQLSFRDWVAAAAAKGDQEALAYLRSKTISGLRGNTVAAKQSTAAGPIAGLQVDGVSQAGTITYKAPGGVIRDDGNRLQLRKEASDETVLLALELAAKRHGNRLTISGDDFFKAKVAHVAARHSLPVVFDDPTIEKARKAAESLGFEQGRAAVSYIDERNEKHARGFDIMKHRQFASTDAGPLEFAGLRNVEGQQLALLKRGQEMLVLPVNAATAARLQRQRVGREIHVSAVGAIQVQGSTRSRE
ncbi:TraI/MobA(P) family conjugative relaxase [Metapseudomonas furukawaii]|uniref:IncP-type DNA relaxase n=1 Tax=Metapseudomonas furukawaii TaxID=1149133 RepID=A0AAD1C6L8_METFU|nr:TraI/MobA(P) family conjugative relaxase [Pseudomonas furukawaii]ELS27576.1 IncP-type DNA relaxase TraI [Pseudomonas furukawaii]BAU77418.1 IncP-type DNA relaxase [Pseudomonas furukawaii]